MEHVRGIYMNREVVMPTLDKAERINNFNEVNVGLSESDALKEANRCLNCKNPRCMLNCPVKIKIPEFISKIKEGDYDGAYEIIAESSSLSSICGRVCPQENQCEKMCIRGLSGDAIMIGALERFVSDHVNNRNVLKKKNNGKKIALIGSGPSSLQCAYDLVINGYNPVIFEALQELGGVLRYGIPNFRLPKSLLDKEIDYLKSLGVEFHTNIVVGKTILLSELESKYDAIFIGTGAGLPKMLNIKGEEYLGVMSANELLTRVNLMSKSTPIKVGENAIVIGGGNVAMDAARVLRRLGSKVTICYRKDESNLKARIEEIKHAKEEGINFEFYLSPKEIVSRDDEHVSSMLFDCVDEKFVPTNVTKEIETDMVVVAIGTNVNKLVLNNSNLENNNGLLKQVINDKYYAGGDVVSSSSTVVNAISQGKEAAINIMKELDKNE